MREKILRELASIETNSHSVTYKKSLLDSAQSENITITEWLHERLLLRAGLPTEAENISEADTMEYAPEETGSSIPQACSCRTHHLGATFAPKLAR